MYPNTPTETESLIELIRSQSPKITDIIKEYIENHNTTKMDKGVRYYFNESDITKRVIYKYENDVKVIDPDATNIKLPTGWHKTLVDQKVSYIAGKPATISSKKDNDPTLDKIIEILDEEFDDTLPELVKHASNKGREWLHVYVDEEGNFDYIIVPAQEFIPIYDNTKRKNLIAGIRFYKLDDGTLKIELWDDQMVTFYEETEQGIVLDMSYEVNPQSHFYYGNSEKKQGYGWGKVPFIEFKNNEEAVSDLEFYKDLIDAFERVFSNSANANEDIQEFIYNLKGYEGTSLQEFMTNLKRYRAIKTNGESGSGVDVVQGDIPVESTEKLLNRLNDSIYQAGQGVDFSTDKFGQNPSGVALQFLYSFLEMKASVMERKFDKALKLLLWFVCEYLNMTENVGANHKDYYFTFNHSMITNEKEQVEMANSSKGNVSDETMLANHPFVDDVQQELNRLKKQEEEYLKMLNPYQFNNTSNTNNDNKNGEE